MLVFFEVRILTNSYEFVQSQLYVLVQFAFPPITLGLGAAFNIALSYEFIRRESYKKYKISHLVKYFQADLMYKYMSMQSDGNWYLFYKVPSLISDYKYINVYTHTKCIYKRDLNIESRAEWHEKDCTKKSIVSINTNQHIRTFMTMSHTAVRLGLTFLISLARMSCSPAEHDIDIAEYFQKLHNSKTV